MTERTPAEIAASLTRRQVAFLSDVIEAEKIGWAGLATGTAAGPQLEELGLLEREQLGFSRPDNRVRYGVGFVPTDLGRAVAAEREYP